MHRRDARVLLMRQGWKYLGGGSFAAVFLSPDEQRVVRVGKPDRGYTAQVKAAIEHPRRTHLVRIYGNVQLSCGGLATEMERLQPVCRVANEQTSRKSAQHTTSRPTASGMTSRLNGLW